MPIYVRVAPGDKPPVVKSMRYKMPGGSVVDVRRAYYLEAIVETYPQGPANSMVLRYDWKLLGQYMPPPDTEIPPVPSLTPDPAIAITFNRTRLSLRHYQNENTERKDWGRRIQYARPDGVVLATSTLNGFTETEIRTWTPAGTEVMARAAFYNEVGVGPWSDWSDVVTTTTS